MPTERPRVTITVTEEHLKEIEAYRYGNKMKNQTQAILSLVRSGLDEIERKNAQYNKIASAPDETGSEAIKISTVELFKDVLEKTGLLDKNQDITDSDLEFLKGMFLAMKAHFQQRKEGGN